MMEIDELLLVLERNRQRLQKIEDDFYEKLRARIRELEEMKNSADENDFMRYEDEIRTLKRLQRKIFEIRTGKIVSAAWADACGQQISDEMENMTAEEKKFFRNLVNLIRKFRSQMLEEGGGEYEAQSDYILVRMKRSLEIQGTDGKKYKLRKEDAVTLPELNAETLIKTGFAEKIEVKDNEVP